MITKDKVIEIFCIIDEFDKNLNAELAKKCYAIFNKVQIFFVSLPSQTVSLSAY